MPPKRTVGNRSAVSGSQDANTKRAKQRNDAAGGQPKDNTDDDETSVVDEAEKKYMLGREITSLRSKLRKAKKDLLALRTAQKDAEFQALQNPEGRQEKFPEFAKNVELWSKYTGATMDQVTFTKEENSRDWFIKGSVEDINFEMTVSCATDEETNKGYVQKFAIRFPDDKEAMKELQPWLLSNEGNIEQILKTLKAYGELTKTRRDGLEACKNEFEETVTVSRDESGQMVVDLGTEETLFFQIKWKIVPSSKHFARVKSVCRIACTAAGDKYIKKNADMGVIKKRLGQAPIEIIQMLAKGITSSQT